jgi:hypothetical protein
LIGIDHILHPVPSCATFGRRTGFSQVVIDNLDLRIRPTVRASDWRAAAVLSVGLAAFLYEVLPTGGNDLASAEHWIVAGPLVVVGISVFSLADLLNVLSLDSSAAADIFGRRISPRLFSLVHLLSTLLAVQV